MKNFFKKIYKNFVIFFFIFLYSKPKLLKKKSFFDKIFKVKFNKDTYFIFEQTFGRVWTNKNDNTAYISKDNILSISSMQFKKFDHINSKNQNINFNSSVKIGTPNLKKKIKGNVLSLLSGGAARTNFTHWLTDIIPRIFIFQKKFNLSIIRKFYVPSIKYSFQLESLKLLGIKKNMLISSETTKHLCAEKLYSTSHPCFFKPTKVKKWSLISLNKAYSHIIPPKNYLKRYQRIFIDRDQIKLIDKDNLQKFSSYRVLLNEKEIKKYLKFQGFFIFKPEKYKFAKQIQIVKAADYIVSLYGAALMMIVFCRPKTKILEIKPKTAGNEFKYISRLNNLNHKQINIKPIIKSQISQNGLIHCSLDNIKKNLNFLGLKI